MEKPGINGKPTRVETSKKILIYCDAIVAITVIVMFVAIFFGADAGSISEVVVALIGLAAASHSFYYWKAKAENMKKLDRSDGITMSGGDNV